MWTSLVDNPEGILIIYENQVPSLDKIFLDEIRIINGVDISCVLRFDLATLPVKLPDKWEKNKVNKVQLQMQLISCEIVSLCNVGQ